MELGKLKNFTLKNDNQKHKNKNYDFPKISCFDYNKEFDVAVAGLNKGNIVIWCKKTEIINIKLYEEDIISYSFESKENKHKGEISVIKAKKIQNNLYFITGSYDRNIIIWDFVYNKPPEVIQTINVHQSGILDWEFFEKDEILLSISNDGILKVFSLEKAKKYFINPLFIQIHEICFKKDIFPYISSFLKSNLDKKQVKENTIFNKIKILKKEWEDLHVFLADSIGNIHILQLKNNKLVYIKSSLNIHRLGIKDLNINIKDSLILTTSFDEYINCFDLNTGKEYFKLKDERNKEYIKLDWISRYKELFYIEKNKNTIFIKNMNIEKNDFEINLDLKDKIQNFKILNENLIIINNWNEIIFYKIQRGLKQQNLFNNLIKSINQIIYLDLNSIYKKSFLNEIIIVLSQDGEIEIWDLLDNSKILNLDCSNKSEAYHINYIESFGLLLSGHINGSLYLWDIELGNCINFIYPKNILDLNSITCSKYLLYTIKEDKNEVIDILLTSGFDGKAYLWELNKKKKNGNEVIIYPQMKFQFFPNQNKKVDLGNEIFSIEYSEITEYIFFAGNFRFIYVYKINKNLNTNYITTLDEHKDSINSLKLDKNILFSISDDGFLIAWDINKLYIINKIEFFKFPINNFKFINNSSYFIITNTIGEIIIYDYLNWKIIKKLNKCKKILCLEYNNKENKLYLGLEEIGIQVIDLKEFNLI